MMDSFVEDRGLISAWDAMVDGTMRHTPSKRSVALKLMEFGSNALSYFEFISQTKGMLKNSEAALENERIFKDVFKGLRENYIAISAPKVDELLQALKHNYNATATNNRALNDIHEAVTNNYNMLKMVSNQLHSTFKLVDTLRMEMVQNVLTVLEANRMSRIEPSLSKIYIIIVGFERQRNEINLLNMPDHVAKLEEEGGVLNFFRDTTLPKGDSLHSIMYDILHQNDAIPQNANDQIAFRALHALYHGTIVYVAIMVFLIEQYSFLTDYYYKIAEFENYNKFFSLTRTTFHDFKHSLVGSEKRSLICDVIDVVITVQRKFIEEGTTKNLSKIKNSLESVKREIINSNLDLIDDVPLKLIGYPFEFDIGKIRTPIGKWKEGASVRYAVQFKEGGKLSRIGEWSEALTVGDDACPTVRIPVDKPWRTRIVFRRFGDDRPEMVAVMEDAFETSFRDVHRDLFDAAGSFGEKSLKEMDTLIRNGGDIGVRLEQGRQAIHAAATAGNIDAAKKIFQNNHAYLQSTDNNGYTPMHIAAETGHDDFVQFLVEHKADLNPTTKTKLLTPLHLSAMHGYLPVVITLLANNSTDVNARDKEGFTPLHAAVFGGNLVVEAFMADNRTNVNAYSNENLTPLHLASLAGYSGIAKILLTNQNVSVSTKASGNLTALHFAVLTERLEMVEILVSKNETNLNSKAVNNWSPLHFALMVKNSKIATELIRNSRTDINAPNEWGIIPLHMASISGDWSIVMELLERGVEVNKTTKDRVTALHFAVIHKHIDVIALLCDHNANLEAETMDKKTPFGIALEAGAFDILLYLQIRKDIANDPDYEEGPHMAARSGYLNVLKILTKGDNLMTLGESIFYSSIDSKDTEVVDYLLERGMGVNIINRKGESPLFYAAEKGSIEMYEHLIAKGAGFYPVDQTPVHAAAKGANLSMVRFLLEKKHFDPNSKTAHGETPLHFATRSGNLDLVKYLEESKGSDVGAKTFRSMTPMDYAIATGCKIDVVKYLISRGADFSDIEAHYFNTFFYAVENGDMELVRYLVEERRVCPLNDVRHKLRRLKYFDLKQLKHLFQILNNRTDLENERRYFNPRSIGITSDFPSEAPQAKGRYPNAFSRVLSTGSGVLSYLSFVYQIKDLIENSEAASKKESDIKKLELGLNCNASVANGGGALHKTDKVDTGSGFSNDLSRTDFPAKLSYLSFAQQMQYLIKNSEAASEKESEFKKLEVGLDCNATVVNGGGALHKTDKVDTGSGFSNDSPRKDFRTKRGIIKLFSTHSDMFSYLKFALQMADLMKNFKEASEKERKFKKFYVIMKNNYNAIRSFQVGEPLKIMEHDSMDDPTEFPLHLAAKSGNLELYKYLVGTQYYGVNSKTPRNETVLHFAARSGEVRLVRYLVDEGMQIDCETIEKKTPLDYAAEYARNFDVIKYFITKGMDFCDRSSGYRETLLYGIKRGNLGLVKYLVNEKGALPQFEETQSVQPLHVASQNGFLSIVKFLLKKKGVTIDPVNDKGEIPLFNAAQSGHLNVVWYLLEKGSDLSFKNKEGNIVQFYACESGNVELVKYLDQRGANLMYRNIYDETPMFSATFGGHLELVKYLYENIHPNISDRAKGNLSLLHYAAQGGELSLLIYLLDKGLNIESTPLAISPLFFGVNSDRIGVVKYLVEKGANVNDKGWDYSEVLKDVREEFKSFLTLTPLHLAAKRGNLEIVTFFVEKGVAVDSRNPMEMTPLHYAIQAGKLDVVKYLLKNNADINVKDMMGMASLHFAVQSGKLDVVRYLMEEGANVNIKDNEEHTPLHEAVSQGKFEMVEYLLEVGAHVNAIDSKKSTPLHEAARSESGRLDVVQCLLDNCADINFQDSEMRTPLHYAVMVGNTDIIQYLVAKRADVNIKDVHGRTPLFYAVGSSRLQISKFLVSNGAFISIMDGAGETPLHYAEKIGSKDIYEYFLEVTHQTILDDEGRTPDDNVKSLDPPSNARRKRSSVSYFEVNEQSSYVHNPSSYFPRLAKDSSTWAPIVENQMVEGSSTALLLLNLLRNKMTHKYLPTRMISESEAMGQSLTLTTSFESAIRQASIETNVSFEALNINFVKTTKEINKRIIEGKYDDIMLLLRLTVNKALAESKFSTLKKTKFMDLLIRNLDLTLHQQLHKYVVKHRS